MADGPPPDVDVSPQLVAFLVEHVEAQLRRGRAAPGPLLESALQALHARSMARLAAAQRQLEHFQALRHALQDEMVRLEALDLPPSPATTRLPRPHAVSTPSLRGSPHPGSRLADAVVRVPVAVPLQTHGEVAAHMAQLQAEYDQATHQLATGHEALNRERAEVAAATAQLSPAVRALVLHLLATSEVRPLSPVMPVMPVMPVTREAPSMPSAPPSPAAEKTSSSPPSSRLIGILFSLWPPRRP